MANCTVPKSLSKDNLPSFSTCYEELQTRLSEIKTLINVWIESDFLEYMSADTRCLYLYSINDIVSLAIQDCEKLKETITLL